MFFRFAKIESHKYQWHYPKSLCALELVLCFSSDMLRPPKQSDWKRLSLDSLFFPRNPLTQNRNLRIFFVQTEKVKEIIESNENSLNYSEKEEQVKIGIGFHLHVKEITECLSKRKTIHGWLEALSSCTWLSSLRSLIWKLSNLALVKWNNLHGERDDSSRIHVIGTALTTLVRCIEIDFLCDSSAVGK